MNNIAGAAGITVSSQNELTGQEGIKAADGIADGYPGDHTKEWVTVGQLTGAWIQLNWSGDVTVSRVILHDRPNLTDNILSGRLLFSDGSAVSVGALPDDGAGLPVDFGARTVQWMRFQIDTAVGSNIGLSEMEVYGSLVSPGLVLDSVIMNPDSIVGGNLSLGTVNLNIVAPNGGITIALSSSDTSVVTVPASVTVVEGASSGTFAATSPGVTVFKSAKIFASYGGST